MMGMGMGKDVYTQKPLTHSVWEARMMRQVAREMKVCSQMGNQGTAANGLRRAAEFIQAGGLGKVTEAHALTNPPISPQAPQVTSPPHNEMPVPKYLHS